MGVLRRRVSDKVVDYLAGDLIDYARTLPAAEKDQAQMEGGIAVRRAEADVGTDHLHRKCQHSDGGIPPLNPKSPENSAALKKGSVQDQNHIVPFKRRSGGNPPSRPSSSHHQTVPPPVRDNWAAEEPAHTRLKIDPVCVLSQRAQGFTPAAAKARCRYKPLHKTQPQQQQPAQPGQPLAIPAISGTAPVLEPDPAYVPLGLGAAAGSAAFLLRGGV
ncbi:MAG: hypothetical protein M1826_006536 [Phylliscum demangeonii]|nr:MAG: hypothetical protein M1826_006536 [Phylliscum demangeonii]